MGTAIKHPVRDRVEPSFAIFDIRALWRLGYDNSGRQRVKHNADLEEHHIAVWYRVGFMSLLGRDPGGQLSVGPFA